jgi:sec-independent protein translocase protein TatA
MPNIGPLELAIVLIIALVIFGPKRLPELGRSMGRGLREFKNSVTGKDEEEELEQSKRELEGSTPASEPVEGEVVADNRT